MLLFGKKELGCFDGGFCFIDFIYLFGVDFIWMNMIGFLGDFC